MSARAGLGALLAAVLWVGGCGWGERSDSGEGEPFAAVTRQGVDAAPDFVVAEIRPPASTWQWFQFMVPVRVCNQGTQVGITQVELFLSEDTTIRPYDPNDPTQPSADWHIGSAYTPWLGPGYCGTAYVQAFVNYTPPSPRAWYVGAIADLRGETPELDEGNNATTGPQIGIGNEADFIVTSVVGPASATPGQGFIAQVRVCNQGTSGGSTEFELYLSADATIRAHDPSSPQPPEDAWLASGSIQWLNSGQCETVYMQASANPPQSPPPNPPAAPLSAWYLGAVVNPTGSQIELNPGNNARAGTRMGIGSGPDFIITSVTGPASATPGQSFIAQVRVCNQGTASGSTDFELYLSADATIRAQDPNSPQPPEDARVASGSTPGLVPGQCETVHVQASANPPPQPPPNPPAVPLSAWYVGAALNPTSSHFELNRDNNTLAGKRMSVGGGPDFVVTEVTGPASLLQSQDFMAQVRVCNQGTEGGGPVSVDVYLSRDTIIYPYWSGLMMEDARVGMGAVSWLVPGQCEVVFVPARADPPPLPSPLPPGEQSLNAWYLGASVNTGGYIYAELGWDNNMLAGTRMGIGYGTDFVITSVAGPASVLEGQPFTAQVRVCNQGTLTHYGELELYLSADATIRPYFGQPQLPPEDARVGWSYTYVLLPGQCEVVPVQGAATPPLQPALPPGGAPLRAWYLGAVVRAGGSAYSFELNNDNDTLAGMRMGIGNGADFIVTSVTGPASATPGQSFIAQARVCNQGTQAGSTEVEVYLSADTALRSPGQSPPPEDARVGSAATSLLQPGQCQVVPVQAGANPPPGGTPLSAWYLGAVVNPTGSTFELNRDNNTLADTRMGVGSGADFFITSVRGPASATPGQAFTAQVRVCNQGTQAGSTQVDVYLSADNLIRPPEPNREPEDVRAGSGATSLLLPGRCEVVQVQMSANLSGWISAWHLGAVVNPTGSTFELSRDNNIHTGMSMGIGNGADFIVTSVTGPASATRGQSFTTQVTVCNQGTQAESALVGIYLSVDGIIRPSNPSSPLPLDDAMVGSGAISLLQPGQCEVVSVDSSANPVAPHYMPSERMGTWYLGAVVNFHIPNGYTTELSIDNNALAGTRMGIGSEADFIVTSVTGPASATQGQSFTAQATVCNQGTLAGSTEVEIYLSEDGTIRPHGSGPPQPPEDSRVGSASTPSLVPGQCQTLPVLASATLPTTSTLGTLPSGWVLGAAVNSSRSTVELDPDNNTLAGARMGVGSGTDFAITSVTGPNSASLGQSISVSARVCNRGTVSGSTSVELYLSADATVTRGGEDLYLGVVSSGTLSPGNCATRSATVPTSAASQGTWFLAAIADPSNTVQELIEDNNSLVGNRIGLGNGADFVINSISVPTNAVRPGQSFSTNVSVCNRGTVAGLTDVALYLSSDTTIDVPTASAPSEDRLVGSFTTATLNAGACATQSVTVVANVPREGTWYLGAIADPTNSRPELIEDNNTRASSRLGVGNLADFTFTALSGPTTATQGQAYTASFTVCNRGTVADSVDVELYFSTDATIPAPSAFPLEDLPQGLLSVGPLNAGSCTTRSFTFNVSVPSAGSWYLGISADPARTRPELFEDNNTRAGTLVSVSP